CAPARAVVVRWRFEVELLARLRPELVTTGACAGGIDIHIQSDARAVARLVALGGRDTGLIIASAPLAVSLSPARFSSDSTLGLEHLDAPGFAMVTWRAGPGPVHLLYACSPLLEASGIAGGRADSPLLTQS